MFKILHSYEAAIRLCQSTDSYFLNHEKNTEDDLFLIFQKDMIRILKCDEGFSIEEVHEVLKFWSQSSKFQLVRGINTIEQLKKLIKKIEITYSISS